MSPSSSRSDNCYRAPYISCSPVLADEIPRPQPGSVERKRKGSAAGARSITEVSGQKEEDEGLVPGCHQVGDLYTTTNLIVESLHISLPT
ncbi:hypothetical protein BHE74_00055861 [Ensete ventricosum]|nr:hypothetical protein GW17_00036041 [Ensete ventricosum]RWW38871.1 hypothetical protein BHE74_00055861 [Ensete ventricosum]